jgi:hypothetical protein
MSLLRFVLKHPYTAPRCRLGSRRVVGEHEPRDNGPPAKQRRLRATKTPHADKLLIANQKSSRR